MQGKTKHFPWFSDTLQYRAYSTVHKFLHRDDGITITAVEISSLRLGTMPRPLHISANNTLLGMRTWLNGWIHFYATKGDEDRANGLRQLQGLLIEVPPTKSLPTSSSVMDDASSDVDDIMNEDVVVLNTGRQDNGRLDPSKITWAQMREKYGKKRAGEDLPQESEMPENTRYPNNGATVVSIVHS